MKTLIIYAHPKTGGHCPYILEKLKDNLASKKINYDIIDLYRIKYDPILHENEHYTRGNKDISPQNKRFQKMISRSDHLIFIYPVWWNSSPAILRGFIERVFTPGFAYNYVNGIPKGLLKGKKATILTTYGAPKIFASLFQKEARKFMEKHVLKFCGIRSRSYYICKATEFNEKQKNTIAKMVEKAIQGCS